jgi:hypothetical protein
MVRAISTIAAAVAADCRAPQHRPQHGVPHARLRALLAPASEDGHAARHHLVAELGEDRR